MVNSMNDFLALKSRARIATHKPLSHGYVEKAETMGEKILLFFARNLDPMTISIVAKIAIIHILAYFVFSLVLRH